LAKKELILGRICTEIGEVKGPVEDVIDLEVVFLTSASLQHQLSHYQPEA
jgi:hypothetical protein